ncbi:MAG: Fe-Mn family superoxide dismutase, partial [Steroidobacteraceae bacterium]
MKDFKIAAFGGLSAASIEAHLGLYKGYAEQTAAVMTELQAAAKAPSTAAVLTSRETLARRLAFEGNGERLHELFFEQFGAPTAPAQGDFDQALASRFGSFQGWQDDILELGKTRGPGWVATCAGAHGIENYWIDLHELTLPAESPILYLVDLWEHAYWTDYGAKGRERYMRDLFAHTNWDILEQRHARAR